MTPTTPDASTNPTHGPAEPIPPTTPYALLRAMASVSDLGLIGQRSIARMEVSTSATARAAETLRAHAMNGSQQSLKHGMDAAQAMLAAKSMQELIDLQTAYAKTMLELYLAHANLVTKTSVSTLSACLAPLVDQKPASAERGERAG